MSGQAADNLEMAGDLTPEQQFVGDVATALIDGGLTAFDGWRASAPHAESLAFDRPVSYEAEINGLRIIVSIGEWQGPDRYATPYAEMEVYDTADRLLGHRRVYAISDHPVTGCAVAIHGAYQARIVTARASALRTLRDRSLV